MGPGRGENSRRSPKRTAPAAFATAIRERGVDAGVSEFRRFTLGRTTSSNTFEPRLEARFSLDTATEEHGYHRHGEHTTMRTPEHL